MAIVRLESVRQLAAMQDRINRIFGGPCRRTTTLLRGDWIPAVDIFENDKHELVITAELPGMKREAIDIRLENNMLTFRGERKQGRRPNGEQFHRVERALRHLQPVVLAAGHGRRRPRRRDYKDGVLTVTLPRREEAEAARRSRCRSPTDRIGGLLERPAFETRPRAPRGGDDVGPTESGASRHVFSVSCRQPCRPQSHRPSRHRVTFASRRRDAARHRPVTSRFLFVDIAAQRAKQLRRGARPRLAEGAERSHKLERVAMARRSPRRSRTRRPSAQTDGLLGGSRRWSIIGTSRARAT